MVPDHSRCAPPRMRCPKDWRGYGTLRHPSGTLGKEHRTWRVRSNLTAARESG
jgi:hypothetical protein